MGSSSLPVQWHHWRCGLAGGAQCQVGQVDCEKPAAMEKDATS